MCFESVHSPDLCHSNPGENDNHGHLECKLKEVGDQHSPKPTNKGVKPGERNKDEDADGQCCLLGITQSEMEPRELEHPALSNHRTEQYRNDTDHRLCDPSQNKAVHEQSEIDRLESAKECGRFSAVANLAKLHVGENFCPAPIARKEKDRQHAADAESPPDPIACNSLSGNYSADEQGSIGGKSCGDHGSAGQPPGNVAPGHEEFFGIAAGTPAVIDADGEVHQ